MFFYGIMSNYYRVGHTSTNQAHNFNHDVGTSGQRPPSGVEQFAPGNRNPKLLVQRITELKNHSNLQDGINLFASFEGEHDVYTYNAVLSCHAQLKAAQKALEIFGEMPKRGIKPDQTTYNTLINACVKAGMTNKAFAIFNEMQGKRIKGNQITYSTLINACAQKGMAEEAFDVFEEMKDNGIEANLITYNTLINACVKAGMTNKAFAIFNEMQGKRIKGNQITYNTLIHACAKAGMAEEAFDVFEEMKDNGIEANLITYSTLINACAKAGMAKEAFDVFNKMPSKEIEVDLITYSALINACAQKGMAKEAFDVFEEMKDNGIEANLIIYSALINACAQCGMAKKALAIFKDMQDNRIEADQITYGTLINACAQDGGYITEGLSILNKVKELYGVDKSSFCQTLNIAYQLMLDLYLRTDNYKEAKALFIEYETEFWQSINHFEESEETKKITFDCHGLTPGVAALYIENYFAYFKTLEIITGKGLHSKKEAFLMKDGLKTYFKTRSDISFTDHPNNSGRITAVKSM